MTPTSSAIIQKVATTLIEAGENDRVNFDPRDLENLAASIADQGLAQPIIVRPRPNGRFQIVAGERRFRACSEFLQWEHIDAIVKELDDEEASAIMLSENTGRADLNVIEEATAYQKRRNVLGWSVARIAQVAGVSEARVKSRLSLLDLVPEVQHLLRFGNFPIGHAEAMTCLDNNRQRIAVRVFTESGGMPLPLFRQLVNNLFTEQSQESLFALESLWVEQVQHMQNLPRRGRNAFTGAPVRNDLPPIKCDPKWSAAQIIERYIADLLAEGYSQEAGAIGTLWTTLVHQNYMAVPSHSALLDAQTGALQ